MSLSYLSKSFPYLLANNNGLCVTQPARLYLLANYNGDGQTTFPSVAVKFNASFAHLFSTCQDVQDQDGAERLFGDPRTSWPSHLHSSWFRLHSGVFKAWRHVREMHQEVLPRKRPNSHGFNSQLFPWGQRPLPCPSQEPGCTPSSGLNCGSICIERIVFSIAFFVCCNKMKYTNMRK